MSVYSTLMRDLENRSEPIDVVVVGLGFVSFGFISSIRNLKGIRVPLVISRRPQEAQQTLEKHGLSSAIEHRTSYIMDLARRGTIAVSDDLSLVSTLESDLALEMTGTVGYGAEVGVRAITAKKHFLTMNPELQVTVGSKLKALAEKNDVLTSDIVGDQPGSLAELIARTRLQGFRVLMAGNMKRFMNHHATQEEMVSWASDKGISPRQCTSFTDGTKQAIEMALVGNYFGMNLLAPGMVGPTVEIVQDALTKFDWTKVRGNGVVDYVIGKTLFPGVFVVAEHLDPNQWKYLRYLGLGDGPRYVLFEPYHLCHLDIAGTIANLVLFGQETIHNTTSPHLGNPAFAKTDLRKGTVLDGIGGDTVYGTVDYLENTSDLLPVGLSEGAILTRDVDQNDPIRLDDVILPTSAATKLARLIQPRPARPFNPSVPAAISIS